MSTTAPPSRFQERAYQTRSAAALRELLHAGRRVVAVGPTGCGKTRIATSVIEAEPGWRALFVVHRYELADQAWRALAATRPACIPPPDRHHTPLVRAWRWTVVDTKPSGFERYVRVTSTGDVRDDSGEVIVSRRGGRWFWRSVDRVSAFEVIPIRRTNRR